MAQLVASSAQPQFLEQSAGGQSRSVVDLGVHLWGWVTLLMHLHFLGAIVRVVFSGLCDDAWYHRGEMMELPWIFPEPDGFGLLLGIPTPARLAAHAVLAWARAAQRGTMTKCTELP
jgi:hypothetical protein